MRFTAKGGVVRELKITDRSLTRLVKRCQDLPGQNLFQYLDEEGEPQPVSSTDVNAYIKEAMGDDFTAKHFRTWGASTIAFEQLCKARRRGHQPQGIARAGRRGARQHGGDQPQILCPSRLDRRGEGECRIRLAALQCPRATKYLTGAERGLIDFLESWTAEQDTRTKAA